MVPDLKYGKLHIILLDMVSYVRTFYKLGRATYMYFFMNDDDGKIVKIYKGHENY